MSYFPFCRLNHVFLHVLYLICLCASGLLHAYSIYLITASYNQGRTIYMIIAGNIGISIMIFIITLENGRWRCAICRVDIFFGKYDSAIQLHIYMHIVAIKNNLPSDTPLIKGVYTNGVEYNLQHNKSTEQEHIPKWFIFVHNMQAPAWFAGTNYLLMQQNDPGWHQDGDY